MPPSTSLTSYGCLLLVCFFVIFLSESRASTVPCTTSEQCEQIILKGSECINNFCSNPYVKGGCLARRLDGWKRIRVCNSDDLPDAEELGYCRAPNPGFNYMELRMAGQNWESAFFQVWIIQILLSEILGVPVTLETGEEGKKLGFYEPTSQLDYGIGYDWDALKNGHAYGDCRLLEQDPQLGYRSCAHFIPETWYALQEKIAQLQAEGILERPHPMGTLGNQGLYIPRHTALYDPSLLTYLGMSGASGNRTEARHKLARIFKRPTRWGEYCEEVSENNCATDDGIAKRAPETEDEARKYHHADFFVGHFRYTERNDCENYPDTCTGHFVDYPCGWTSFAQQQIYHLGIALESNGESPGANGYQYGEMVDIWTAANATKSHIVMQWWWPEALYQTFLGTAFEFQRVAFPPATLDCVDGRIDMENRCEGATLEDRVGSAVGSCDEPPFALQRVVTANLRDIIYDPSIPEVLRNPGYDAIKEILLDELQIGKIFDYWLKRGSDKWNFDPRDAACRWLTENFDTVRTWVPESYPRITKENDQVFEEPLFLASVIVAGISFICNILSIYGVIRYRKKKCMVYAQVEFLLILLVGMVMVNIGSIFLVAPAKDWVCVTIVWTSILGYTLELIPLIVKINAINKIVLGESGTETQVLKRRNLYGEVIAVVIIVAVFLTVWSIVDTPHKSSQYDLTSEKTEYQEYIVRFSDFCESDSEIWRLLATAWHSLMLITAAAMAYQTRKIKGSLNESMILAILIYSHSIFVILRLMLFFSEDRLSVWNVPRYLSIVYSADGIATCCIYFFPKFLCADDSTDGLTGELSKLAIGTTVMRRASNLFARRNTMHGTATTSQPTTSLPTTSQPTSALPTTSQPEEAAVPSQQFLERLSNVNNDISDGSSSEDDKKLTVPDNEDLGAPDYSLAKDSIASN